ncbi:MAG: sigma-54-dependent transcriptional regulator [Rhodoferax sp.]
MTWEQIDAARCHPGPARDRAPSVPAKVLIVDDFEDARWVLSCLVRQMGHIPLVAASAGEALACIRAEPLDLVLLDVGLPDMDGFEVLAQAKAHDKTLYVIMVTANGKAHDAVRAIRAGAYDYVDKPFNNESVALTVRQALQEKTMKGQRRQSLSPLPKQAESLVDSMGRSAAIARIQAEVERVAKTNFSVMVTGESGTGKELVSQAIHAWSQRATQPFVAVDCGAIPEALIESELFGHEKGAFTGAHQTKLGAFELASGGTIFLDEIGNLPLAMQGKLLRVLETRRVHRIGGADGRATDFRLVVATNADLLAMVERQSFRGDLYHRLAEYTICLPTLRERKEDMEFLVHRFLVQTNKELGKQVTGLTDAVWSILRSYGWPGNVRELRNQLRRAVLLCDDPEGLVTPGCLGTLDRRSAEHPACKGVQSERRRPEARSPCPLCEAKEFLEYEGVLPLKELVARVTGQMERAILLQVLRQTDWNKAQAARMLQLDYKTIHNKLKAYEISSPRHEETPVNPQDDDY